MEFSQSFYKRDGSPYPAGVAGTLAWGRDFEDLAMRLVALSASPWGDRISTVWHGINHAWRDEAPLIFETMVFRRRDGQEIYQARYSTEAAARAGHLHAAHLCRVPPFLRRFMPDWPDH